MSLVSGALSQRLSLSNILPHQGEAVIILHIRHAGAGPYCPLNRAVSIKLRGRWDTLERASTSFLRG
jgi:hypothetical protein